MPADEQQNSSQVKTEERRGAVMVFLVPALLVRINGTQFGHLERRVKTVRVTPCKPAQATSKRDCERERGRALMLISTSRPSNSKKRSSRSMENPESRPRMRAETLG